MEENILGPSDSGMLLFISKPRDDLIQLYLRCLRLFLFFLQLFLVTLKSWSGFFLVQENNSYRPKERTYLPITGSKFRSCSLSGFCMPSVLRAWLPHRMLRECTWETLRRQTWLQQFFHTQHVQRQPLVCSCSQEKHVRNMLSQIHIVLNLN